MRTVTFASIGTNLVFSDEIRSHVGGTVREGASLEDIADALAETARDTNPVIVVAMADDGRAISMIDQLTGDERDDMKTDLMINSVVVYLNGDDPQTTVH